MTEQGGEQKYIKCSKCKCWYLNSSFNLLKDFGYDRLDRLYKTCKKCRSKKNVNNYNSESLQNLELQKMGIPENVVDQIMGFHGEIYGMFPNEVIDSKCLNFEEIKKYIRNNNWKLKLETSGGRGGSWGTHYIIINVVKNMIDDIIKDGTFVSFSYPTKYGFMESSGRIEEYSNDCVKIGKYFMKLDKMKYLKIKKMYNHETYSNTDD